MASGNKRYFVYILSNFKRTVVYVGITNNLIRRVYEHKENMVDGFTKDYQVHDLLYFEDYEDPKIAIAREKQIKNWTRRKKNALIASQNPTLKDLYKSLI